METPLSPRYYHLEIHPLTGGWGIFRKGSENRRENAVGVLMNGRTLIAWGKTKNALRKSLEDAGCHVARPSHGAWMARVDKEATTEIVPVVQDSVALWGLKAVSRDAQGLRICKVRGRKIPDWHPVYVY